MVKEIFYFEDESCVVSSVHISVIILHLDLELITFSHQSRLSGEMYSANCVKISVSSITCFVLC